MAQINYSRLYREEKSGNGANQTKESDEDEVKSLNTEELEKIKVRKSGFDPVGTFGKAGSWRLLSSEIWDFVFV